MTERRPKRELTTRDQEILKEVILAYILSGEPVSSRTIAKRSRYGLSAATIRNIMADLEELGYLTQPHTSAGRVPVAAGYHLFIDSLMPPRPISAREKRYIDRNLMQVPGDVGQLLAATSHLLSELSHQVGMVVTPAMEGTVLKAVEFVALSDRKLLCVVVSTSGFIDSKIVETGEQLPREELVRISNYLTENFAGLTLREARDRLVRLMAEERAQMDHHLSLAIHLARQGLETDQEPEVIVEGTSAVLGQPELADLQRVRRLLETFADKARLVEILNQCMQGEGVRVLIGEDSELTLELDFSLVATAYGVGGKRLGTIGIFGPSRMEYQRVIPLVHYLGERLSQVLARIIHDAP